MKTAAASGPPEGAITSVSAGVVRGWVARPPARRLVLLVGRRRIAAADPILSSDNQRMEFAIDARGCPPDLLAASELLIEVAFLGDPSPPFAATTAKTAEFFNPSQLPAARAVSLEGFVDEQTGRLVRGWVRDETRPERRLELFVFAGDRYLGRFVSDRPRPDVASTGRGDGRYGFEVALPEVEPATVTVIAGEPEFWRIPQGAHARGKRGPRQRLPDTLAEFARVLTSTEPFPKKVFVIDKVKHGAMPDAFAPDYVFLALDFLRQEMVSTGEAMTGGWRQRLRSWGHMRALGTRIRRLEELAATIAEGPRLLKVSAEKRKHANG